MKRRNRDLLIVFGLLLSLTACKGKEPEQTAPAPAPKTPAAAQPQQSADASATAREAFDFSTKRDPFKPHVQEVKPDAKSSRDRAALPIQNFELSQFRVTGIIVGLKENIAQVIDPTGKAYTLKKGMVIGNRDGRVTVIAPTYIEVIERVTDDSGKTKSQTERLMIPKKN